MHALSKEYNIVRNIVILYIRHTLWIMFSNNLYRIVQKDASTRNRIYIVISRNESESANGKKKCVNVCVLWMYGLRCFLKSNFYNHHIVCQNSDSKYWLLTKRYSICIFYNNCICVSFICLWGLTFLIEKYQLLYYCNCTIYINLLYSLAYFSCMDSVDNEKHKYELIYYNAYSSPMSHITNI